MSRILSTGFTEFDQSKFHEVVSTDTVINKPQFGQAFWGSTLRYVNGGLVTSDWNDWTNDNNYRAFDYGISYKLHRNSKICVIDSIEDYDNILDKYGAKSKLGFYDNGKCYIDFVKISNDYDAFHLTRKGFYQNRMFYNIERNNIADFHAYDSESWIILNPNCINKGSILTHHNLYKGGFIYGDE